MPIEVRANEVTQSELKALKSALIDRQPLPLPMNSVDAAVAELHEMLLELRSFASAILEGDLSQSLKQKGYMFGVMKSLQGNIRSLSLQARSVLKTESAPRTDSSEDMSESFHSVTKQLIETKKQLEETNQILKLSMDTDALTGLFNFSFLMKSLENEIERSRRYDAPLSILVLDIDHFKKINDMHGYRIGDAVLEKTAALIRQMLRPSDIAGRYGSGEFMVVLPNTDGVGACALGERIRLLVSTTPFTESDIVVAVSTGCAQWENHKMADLIQEAENNLHAARHKRKSRSHSAGKTV